MWPPDLPIGFSRTVTSLPHNDPFSRYLGWGAAVVSSPWPNKAADPIRSRVLGTRSLRGVCFPEASPPFNRYTSPDP
jgi:hypothetical protein